MESMLNGNISPIIEQMTKFHESKSPREFKDYNEAAFQNTIELLLTVENWYLK